MAPKSASTTSSARGEGSPAGTSRSRSTRGGGLVERELGAAGHVAALGGDLVAAGAVLGEEAEADRDAAALRVRVRHRLALTERGDVGDERVDLVRREERVAPRRLVVRVP